MFKTERHELDYERTDDVSVLSDFYCGIDEMDEHIHKRLQSDIDSEINSETFIIRNDGEIVATTTIVKKDIEIEVPDGKFSLEAMEIEYLAVRKDMQRKGIGKQILAWIERKVYDECKEIRYLSVCAYIDVDTKYTAEPFYAKSQFMPNSKPHPLANHVKMVKIIR